MKKRSRIDRAISRIWRNLCDRVRRLGHWIPDKKRAQERIRIALTVGKCRYCGEKLIPSIISVDHRIPIDRGGMSSLDNLDVECCKKCNRRKGQLTEDEFRAFLRVINKFDAAARKYILMKLSSAPVFWKRA